MLDDPILGFYFPKGGDMVLIDGDSYRPTPIMEPFM